MFWIFWWLLIVMPSWWVKIAGNASVTGCDPKCRCCRYVAIATKPRSALARSG